MNRSSSPARLLAPAALVAAFLAFVIVIASSSTGGGDGGGTKSQKESNRSSSGESSRTRTSASKSTTYIVKPGDSLSTISDRTGIAIVKLSQLNPDVDPQALISGQCVALTAPSDCK